MKGTINQGIQELVLTRFGEETWLKIKESAGCEEPFFSLYQDYPDQMTVDLIQAASAESGLSVETIMVEFGKFWITNTGRKNYSVYFNIAGNNTREFLENVNRIHSMVTRNIPNARPPQFKIQDFENGKMRLHYFSDRRLCFVVKGLILGLGELFNEKLQVESVACALKGDSHCIMEVVFL